MKKFPIRKFLNWLKKQPDNRKFYYLNGHEIHAKFNNGCPICMFIGECFPKMTNWGVQGNYIRVLNNDKAISIPEKLNIVLKNLSYVFNTKELKEAYECNNE